MTEQNEPVDNDARPELTGAAPDATSADPTDAEAQGSARDSAQSSGSLAPDPSSPKKKRKKRKPQADAPHRREGVPGFAQGFPSDPEIDRLLMLFERGNYAAMRAGATRIAETSDQSDVRRAARELLRRTAPDPLAVTLILAATALLAFLSLWYWSHAHAAP